MEETQVVVSSSSISEEKEPRVKRKVWKVFFWIIVVVGLSVFVLMFLCIPHQVHSGDNILFKEKGYYFSEKITYLFRNPKVGDRVVFSNDTNGFFMDYVGVVVNIFTDSSTVGKLFTEYDIVSTYNSQRPWRISRDRIVSRIYFPFSSVGTSKDLIENGAWTITPSPIPLQLPVSGSKTYNGKTLPDNWIKYESKNKKYSFYHPIDLKEDTSSYDENVTFSLINKPNYFEVFVKKIALESGNDVGKTIAKDVNLSTVPTFQRVIINNSISGFELSRSVDNFSRLVRVVYLPREDAIFSVSMRTPLPMPDSTYENTFDKMLGSFEFSQ